MVIAQAGPNIPVPSAGFQALLLDYYRCPEIVPDFIGAHDEAATPAPFDVSGIVNHLRYERYVNYSGWRPKAQESWLRDFYYWLRPIFPIGFRKHLQRIYLRDWNTIPFPDWPVDRSVDVLLERLLVVAMQALDTDRLPFIWFWPRGYKACAIVTHDVETLTGRKFSERLMDIDDAFGIKASFQIVPEKRYRVPAGYLETIRERGFEVNVHGLDHNGNLFRGREPFLARAERINRYAELFKARGFRSPSLYRNIDWLQDLNFFYDMSVPNVGRLDPQRGGCCTVMPYFLPGGMTELPLTTTQDYSLFHILKDYSTRLWKQEMKMVLEGHGLISLLVHPDYIVSSRAQDVYRDLLDEVQRLQSDERVWLTLPANLDRWWRQRSAMTLVRSGEDWTIQGAGSDQAVLAYACLNGDRLVYQFDFRQ